MQQLGSSTCGKQGGGKGRSFELPDGSGEDCDGCLVPSRVAARVGGENNEKLNAWLENLTLPSMGPVLDEEECSPSPDVPLACAHAFERYHSIDDLRPDSEQGIETNEPEMDGRRVANFVRNAIDGGDVACGWQNQGWAISWNDIALDRHQNWIWASKTGTSWRARLAQRKRDRKDRQEQEIFLKQIYMDQHAEFHDVDILSAMSVVSGLQHPNINTVIGASLHNNDFYVVSEFSAEGSLQDLILESHGQKSSINRALGFSTLMTDKSAQWISGVLDAVEYMHSIGVCHGRITASNVLVTDDRSICKLCDCHLNASLLDDTKTTPSSTRDPSDETAQDLFDVGLIAWQIGAVRLLECQWAEKPAQFQGVKRLQAAWLPFQELTLAGCKDRYMRRMFLALSGTGGVCSATDALKMIVDGKVKQRVEDTSGGRGRTSSSKFRSMGFRGLPSMGFRRVASTSSSQGPQQQQVDASRHSGQSSEVPETFRREKSADSDTQASGRDTMVPPNWGAAVEAGEKRTLMMPPKCKSYSGRMGGALGPSPMIDETQTVSGEPKMVSPSNSQASPTSLDAIGGVLLRNRVRFHSVTGASPQAANAPHGLDFFRWGLSAPAEAAAAAPQPAMRSTSQERISTGGKKSGVASEAGALANRSDQRCSGMLDSVRAPVQPPEDDGCSSEHRMEHQMSSCADADVRTYVGGVDTDLSDNGKKKRRRPPRMATLVQSISSSLGRVPISTQNGRG